MLGRLCLLPAGVDAEDIAALCPDIALARLALGRLYPTPTQTAFVDLAERQLGLSADIGRAWLKKNAPNIDRACRDRWPGTAELELEAIMRGDAGLVTEHVADLAAREGSGELARALVAEALTAADTQAWATIRLLLEVALRIDKRLDNRDGEANTLYELGQLALKCEDLDTAHGRLSAARSSYAVIHQKARWLEPEFRALERARARSAEADEHLAIARNQGDQGEAMKAVTCLLDGGLPLRAADIAAEFALVIGTDGVVRPKP